METLIHSLTILILLRCGNVRLAPLFGSWQSFREDELFDLHYVMCLAKSGDKAAEQTMAILTPAYDLEVLTRGMRVLKDDWHRFVRRRVPLPPEVLAAGEILQGRQNPRRFPPFEADFQKTWPRCIAPAVSFVAR